MSGGWKRAKHAGRRPLDGRVRRLMEQSLLADHERQFATPHCAWHELLATETAHKRRTAPRRDPRCLQGAQANSAGDALAHGRAAEPALRGMRLETLATAQARELAQHRNATPARAGNERNVKHQIANHDGSTNTDHREALVREPHWLASRRRTDGPPEPWCRTRPPLCVFTQTCEPPNVGHERRLEACEARWKTSARWKG